MIDRRAIPTITTQQMIEVDRLMTEVYKIGLVQMMENAGRNLAHLARSRFFDGNPDRKSVVILAGTGGNGGGALVCARRLHTWGAKVAVVITQPDGEFSDIPRHQLQILRKMNAHVFTPNELLGISPPTLIVDGIIGYSLSGSPRGAAADLISWANNSGSPILSLDVPSGVDTETGDVHSPAIRATATMTLALPKVGLMKEEASPCVGELYLADIGVPPALYASDTVNIRVGAMFAEEEILRLK